MNDRDPLSCVASFALADLLLLTARVMSAPDERDTAAFAFSGDELAALLEAVGTDPGSDAVRAFQALVEEARAADREAWRREFTRLFHGPIVCPANETAYVRRDKGVLIGDICGFYRAFGFEADSASGEKADHLVCELEFLGALLVMLGQVERDGETENTAIVEAAVRSFLLEHLGDWLGLFCLRLASTSDLPLYARSVEAIHALWEILARRFDLPDLDATGLEVDEDAWTDDGTPYECEMAEAELPDRLVTLTGPPDTGLPQA